MKFCPKCQNKYTDNTLQFCLQDGTHLIGGEESERINPDTVESIADEGPETVISGKRPERIVFEIPDSNEPTYQPKQPVNTTSVHVEEKSSKTLIAVLLTAFVMLILFGIAGVGAYFYFNKGQTNVVKGLDNSQNTNNKVPSDNSNKSEKTPADKIDPSEIRKSVSSRIQSWKKSAESRNLSSYMGNYADPLDFYYTKGNTSKTSVTADKKRAFAKYDTMKVRLTNMRIQANKAGTKANAIFDKEWLFANSKGKQTGKVRSQFLLKKVDGKWLIAGEKDLKVYYVKK